MEKVTPTVESKENKSAGNENKKGCTVEPAYDPRKHIPPHLQKKSVQKKRTQKFYFPQSKEDGEEGVQFPCSS